MKRWIALVAVAALLAACGDDGGTTVELDAGDSLSEVSRDAGDQLDVSLEANPTTGYSWELGPLPEGLQLVSSEFEEPGGSLVGAPGMQRFVFEAVGAGSGILRFEYVRVFEDPVVAEQIVEYVLTITGD
ncbi:MAG: protease inhibitor I42 family protein [Acidobacteriota bacterium]